MQIFSICPKSFASNTYLVTSKSSAFVIDPSVSVDAITAKLNELNVTLKGIFLTHGHFDHTISVDTLREKFDVPVYIHKDDACMLTDGHLNGFYTFFQKDCVHKPADVLFEDGYETQLDGEFFSVLHTPGHSKGSCCFVFKEDNGNIGLITGDTLFSDSIGRCDLYGGDEFEIAKSIQSLFPFEKNSMIYPGHNDTSTLVDALNNVAYFFDI